MKPSWNLSVCGLNCAQCDIYHASHGNEKMRQEIVDWFKEKRGKTIKPEEVRCEGCRGPLEANWSSDCEMLKCAGNRKVDYCFQCKDFPCQIVNAFVSDGTPHHKRTVENMKRAKEIGITVWLAEQDKKGPPAFCP